MNLKKVKSFSKISDDLSNKFIKSGILIARWASEAPPVFPTLSLGRLVKWNNYQNGQGDCLIGVSQGTVFGKVEPKIRNSEIF